MEKFKPWLEISSTGIQSIGRCPYATASILSNGVVGTLGVFSDGVFIPDPTGAIIDGKRINIAVGAGRELGIDVTSGSGAISTAVIDVDGASSGVSTRVETLVYAATAVNGVSFTHDRTQASTGSNIFMNNLRVVRSNLGDGTAAIKIYGDVEYWGTDSVVTVTLPTGLLTDPFIGTKRALRNELNVADYVHMRVYVDYFTLNRDDNITGDSTFYFECEGIGDW